MGFFGLGKKIYGGIVTRGGNILAKGVGKVIGRKPVPVTTKQFLKTKAGKVLSTSAVVTGSALGVVTAPKWAPAVASMAVKKPLTTLIVGGLASTAGGRILLSKGVEGAYVGSKEVGKIYEKEKDISVGKALAVGGATVAGIAGLAMAPSLIEKGKGKLEAGKEAIKGLGKDTPAVPVETLEAPVPVESVAPAGDVITPTPPITPETVSLDDPKKKPAKKRRYKARRQKISQRVNVIVTQQNLNKGFSIKYLNPQILN